MTEPSDEEQANIESLMNEPPPGGDHGPARRKGWGLIVLPDPAQRRGLWFRLQDGALELCSGREGDDCYARLSIGDHLTEKVFVDLIEVLTSLRWAADLRGDNYETSNAMGAELKRVFGELRELDHPIARVIRLRLQQHWHTKDDDE